MADGEVIEAPFVLPDEQLEILARDTVVAPLVALGLIPEVLNAIDVILAQRERSKQILAQ